MQGYWFARPMDHCAMEDRLRAERASGRQQVTSLARRVAMR